MPAVSEEAAPPLPFISLRNDPPTTAALGTPLVEPVFALPVSDVDVAADALVVVAELVVPVTTADEDNDTAVDDDDEPGGPPPVLEEEELVPVIVGPESDAAPGPIDALVTLPMLPADAAWANPPPPPPPPIADAGDDVAVAEDVPAATDKGSTFRFAAASASRRTGGGHA